MVHGVLMALELLQAIRSSSSRASMREATRSSASRPWTRARSWPSLTSWSALHVVEQVPCRRPLLR